MKRRDFLVLTAAAAVAGLAAPLPASAAGVDIEGILRDPETPTAGNPDGDVTVVVFSDYNCPYCKKSLPDLERVAQEDGKVRLVYKDWPILTEASTYGARLALAARYQGKYKAVHDALMAIPGRKIPQEQMREAIVKSGVDVPRLDADLAANGAAIDALLARNAAQADSIGLQGTPTYLIGPFRTSTLDYAGFKAALAEARRRQAAK